MTKNLEKSKQIQKEKLILRKTVRQKHMEDKVLLQIDIEKILREKAGDKAKFIPGFLISYLKHIVHQDQVNEHLRNTQDKVGVDFLKATLEYLDTKVQVSGIEHLPSEGLCTFVSNHPLGGLDGIGLGYILGQHYKGKIKYIVNDLLMHLPGLAPLCIPVNKTGNQSRDLPRMIEAGFRSNDHIIMFPAGLCSRRINGKIQDVAWGKAFITKSIETQRMVVPIHFEGRNSDFFYRLDSLRKMLGIKFNIAMLYLADEMFKNQHHTFHVTIGKPIPWQTFDRTKTPTQWAAYVRDLVYKLNE